MSKAGVNEAGGGTVLLADFPAPCFIISADRVVLVSNAAAEAIAHGDFGERTANEVILEQLDALKAGRRTAWSSDREFVVQMGREPDARFFLPQFSESGEGWTILFSEVSGLWEASRSTTRAFALLGHEVKTPITSIRMALHLLLEEKLGALAPEQRELIEASRDDCENMLRLVQQINEIFLIESGQEALTRTLVEPSMLLANPLAETRPLFDRNAQQVVIHAPTEELPRLYIDVGKVERALAELLKNTALLSQRGENISVSLSVGENWLRIGVSCPARTEGSLDRKSRAAETFGLRKGPAGADLGLAICKALVVAQGGRTGSKLTDERQELYLEFPTQSSP
ncbi:MAG: HAMP domain-containing sensor histidine kinase [Nibricoccus sp.]